MLKGSKWALPRIAAAAGFQLAARNRADLKVRALFAIAGL
jgi:hypothetical protein